MKLYILAVGNKMPGWVDAGFVEYARRMPPEINIKLINIKPEKRDSGKNVEQILSSESLRIKAAVPIRCRTVILDEYGTQWSTVKLADKIKEWMTHGGDTSFIIGGADGLHPDIKQMASETLALSAMTLPHGLVRVLLAEQLYRAVSITKRHPYHRE
ncbi:MAG: 23S rRNA (pseudouridine(1915)-N(3))-methyltransferase RlmH [Nitrosomonas sp.]|nr:23S rRNA (pseudouridine(1915)-N(3))-methyltransferase RlmH [Nitrosomonas sp.]MDP1950308.1 23S rRNA (pseudouridine(1915)-N(3))-methyltransferase RlmH [Nitrosomonas sp.]